MNQLGTALRSLRVFHDLSQTDLADKLQISKSYLSEIESGRKEPTIALLTQYCKLFEVPVSSLLFFVEHVENSRSSGAGVIAPKILKLLDWISEAKPTSSGQRKPPRPEISRTYKPRNLRKTS
jgi:transcriptional regulator with XRE-family HTH domain